MSTKCLLSLESCEESGARFCLLIPITVPATALRLAIIINSYGIFLHRHFFLVPLFLWSLCSHAMALRPAPAIFSLFSIILPRLACASLLIARCALLRSALVTSLFIGVPPHVSRERYSTSTYTHFNKYTQPPLQSWHSVTQMVTHSKI